MFKLLIEIYKIEKINLWTGFILANIAIIFGSIAYKDSETGIIPSFIVIVTVFSTLFNWKYKNLLQGGLILTPLSFSKQYFSLLIAKTIALIVYMITYVAMSAIAFRLFNLWTEMYFFDIRTLFQLGMTLIITIGMFPDLRFLLSKRKKYLSLSYSIIILFFLSWLVVFGWFAFPWLTFPNYFKIFIPFEIIDFWFIIVCSIHIFLAFRLFIKRKSIMEAKA